MARTFSLKASLLWLTAMCVLLAVGVAFALATLGAFVMGVYVLPTALVCAFAAYCLKPYPVPLWWSLIGAVLGWLMTPGYSIYYATPPGFWKVILNGLFSSALPPAAAALGCAWLASFVAAPTYPKERG